MKTYRNMNWTKRDHECTNLVACQSPDVAPNGNWMPCGESVLFGLTMLYRRGDTFFWGYL